jgi:hypothetical protein
MNYKSLAEEYIKEAKELNSHIAEIKKQYYFTTSMADKDLDFRVKTLYSMYLELKHIGEYLMCRYGGKNDD